MRDVDIIAVQLDHDSRIRVKPRLLPPWRGYDFIHRAAGWVRWDEVSHELYVLREKREPAMEQFARICNVVLSEYGDRLVITPSTGLDLLPSEIRVQLQAPDAENNCS